MSSYPACQKAVVLMSGGLDSAVSLAHWLSIDGYTASLAVTMDYGQRVVRQEIRAARRLAAHYGVTHQVIDLPWLKQHLPTGYQVGGRAHAEGLGVADVWVPNRNGVLLNIASSLAEAVGAGTVLFGANQEEAEAGFPDNTQAYWDRVNAGLELSTMNQVQVKAPVGLLTKSEIGQLAQQLNVPLDFVWSCYEDGEVPCGICASCQLFKKATETLTSSHTS